MQPTHRSSPIMCRLFYIHVVISPKYLHQKGYSTVDWPRWRNNTTGKKGPAPRSCIGPAPARAGPGHTQLKTVPVHVEDPFRGCKQYQILKSKRLILQVQQWHSSTRLWLSYRPWRWSGGSIHHLTPQGKLLSRNIMTWRPATGDRQHRTPATLPKAFVEGPGLILSRGGQNIRRHLWNTPKNSQKFAGVWNLFIKSAIKYYVTSVKDVQCH